jgi:hypothetical protein
MLALLSRVVFGEEISLPILDRIGIATRLRSLLGGQQSEDLRLTADRLGVEESALRLSMDELAPYPTVAVVVAAIRKYGLDPTWLLTGQYDAGTHRSAIESDDIASNVRNMMGAGPPRLAERRTERSSDLPD